MPAHLARWQLPPGWNWGAEGLVGEHRHYQEVIDGFGRSLSLVTAPNPAHHAWLRAEAHHLAHRNHPSIPAAYHYWTVEGSTRRGPGYLRRWIIGETVRAYLARIGTAEIPYVFQVLRGVGSTLAYLHDTRAAHGALTGDTVWVTPAGRLWLLEWQWAIPRNEIPVGLCPVVPGCSIGDTRAPYTTPPEWSDAGWQPTPASDQWQLAATCFVALTGENPPSEDVPPVKLLRPECPESLASAMDRALLPNPSERFPTMGAMLRVADRGYESRSSVVIMAEPANEEISDEARVRWAVGDDYEVLSLLGSGTFGTVWRVRDLSLEREVALKVLHAAIAGRIGAVGAFWNEAKLAAQLAHPGIVPIYDWDSRAGVSWYTMELAEEGSLARLVSRAGPRQLPEIADKVQLALDALSAAHAVGIVHRDLKPENLLVDRYRRWRITDFGIANALGGQAAGTTGTPQFAAPEQLLGEPFGPSVDLYALAGIVVFALTGSPPFPDGDVRAIIGRQLSMALDLTSFSPAVAAWLRRALAPAPEDRFGTAAETRDAWMRAVRSTARRERGTWWRRDTAGFAR